VIKKIAIPYVTIARPVTLTGLAGFARSSAALTIRPGGLGLGIIFRRRGVAVRLRPSILARHSIQHTTSISTPAGQIHTVEHLLGVVQGLCITDLVIDVEEPGHVPFLDGSGEPYLRAIAGVGLVVSESSASTGFAIDERLVLKSHESEAQAEKGHDLHIDSRISFPQPIGKQRLIYRNSAQALEEIASARSFIGQAWNRKPFTHFYAFDRRGKGPEESNLITHDGQTYDVELRMIDECARHKTLDVLGDLMILGAPIAGQFTFDRPGHALLQELVLALAGLSPSSPVEEAYFHGDLEQLARFPNAPWMPTCPVTKGGLSTRSPEAYLTIIDQFLVDVRERYRPREGKTYCNIFVWDVTSALGAEIPHWMSPTGAPAGPDVPFASRVTINQMRNWLVDRGAKYGWTRVSVTDAIARAARGFPTVAFRESVEGSGHAAMLLPLYSSGGEPLVAQAGGRCFSRGRLSEAFGDKAPEFWTHA